MPYSYFELYGVVVCFVIVLTAVVMHINRACAVLRRSGALYITVTSFHFHCEKVMLENIKTLFYFFLQKHYSTYQG